MIVEDEPGIREELCLLLANAGYEAIAVGEFTAVAEQVAAAAPDLLLLDVELPGADGFALCAQIRRGSRVPILFVTGKSSPIDELKALSLGGDDFVSKPYNIPVLLARIASVLRRAGKGAGECVEAAGMRLDLSRSTLTTAAGNVELTRNESRILCCLMREPGKIVSRADFIEFLCDSQIYIDDNTLSVNINRLREKLSPLGLADVIRTRRGMGYSL